MSNRGEILKAKKSKHIPKVAKGMQTFDAFAAAAGRDTEKLQHQYSIQPILQVECC